MLVIAGRYDRSDPPLYSLQYKEFAPQAEFVMLERSGHNFFLEENAAMIRALRGFLGERRYTRSWTCGCQRANCPSVWMAPITPRPGIGPIVRNPFDRL